MTMRNARRSVAYDGSVLSAPLTNDSGWMDKVAHRITRPRLTRAACLVLMITGWVSMLPAFGQTPPQKVLLWPDGAPGALGSQAEDQPRLTLFPLAKDPAHPARSAVIVVPGGGYHVLVTTYEGVDPAKWLNNLGVSAFMLEYRLPPRYRHPVELEDAARALRWVRAHADEYGIDPHRIGIWGFSAGGHLASTLATHFDAGNVAAADPIDRVSSRPDFVILSYPVIDPIGPGSIATFKTLIGDPPDPRLVRELSNDLHVTADTPPAFLVQADDDPVVSSDSSVNYYLALRHAGVPAELHIYQRGGHGFGLAPLDPVLSSWTTRLADWLRGLDNAN
jgi:acetyl esterase/lipase